jgi:histidyl-tRNA synthetase
MAVQKPTIPSGTRDFSPEEMVKRNYIFDTIKKVFQLYGYLPIETPAMENLSTLLGKYGEEGDKLLFKVLNSGDFLSNVKTDDFGNKESNKVALQISEKGLRYDLTVPFARYVVMHRNDINFPFKRYQIQPVWRADRPQRGRYREFYQCDVDVIGSDALLNEVELIQMIDDIFSRLQVAVEIKLNNRKILAGIAEMVGENDKMMDITVAIDKLDKIGIEKVNSELLDKGVSEAAIEKLQPILTMKGTQQEKLLLLRELLQTSETGMKGIEETLYIMNKVAELGVESMVELDLTLARGLNYYTGAIIEVKAADVKIGSICGGGRYDNLTGIFGMDGTSGVGISFGADRIYDVLNELDLFPENKELSTMVFFVNFGEEEEKYTLRVLQKVRKAGINAELFPTADKMKKQMNYADKKNIPFVVIIGQDEIEKDVLSVKNMKTGEQEEMRLTDFIMKVKAF